MGCHDLENFSGHITIGHHRFRFNFSLKHFKIIMKDESIPKVTLLRDISSILWALPPLLNKGKDYNGLITNLIEKNWYYPEDGNINLPAVKDLITDAGIPYGKLKKSLNEIFEDIITSDTLKLAFTDIEHRLCITYFRKSLCFRIKSILVVPRVGE